MKSAGNENRLGGRLTACWLAVVCSFVLVNCGGAERTKDDSNGAPVTGGESGTSTTGSDSGTVGTGSTFPTVTDFAAPGPFTTTTVSEGPDCTVFRPNALGEDGRKHPVILWGNGTTATPIVYQAVLTHWASHGFIVIAANTTSAGTGQEMIACLDDIIMQGNTAGSAYAGNIDTDRVGTSGHSQGGAGAIMAGRDPRVTVTAPLQPYTSAGFGGFETSSISEQHGPMFLMSGSDDRVARPIPNQQIVFDTANVSVFWGTLDGATHVGTGTGDIGGYRGPATAWFRWHLMGDASARDLFYGPNCGLCTDPNWTVQRKDIQ